jgi:undecaprenyl diphosphate synthase
MVVSTSNLAHLLLCAGTVAEWANTDAAQWRERLHLVARATHTGGGAWATIVPYTGAASDGAERVQSMLVEQCAGIRYGERVVVHSDDGVTLVVDPLADGRRRIADVVARLGSGVISEQRMSSELAAPAPGEPDLIVVLGKPTRLPVSLVWELAYAELVFLDAPWGALDSEHLEMAIDDFRRRDRRFGGVDS